MDAMIVRAAATYAALVLIKQYKNETTQTQQGPFELALALFAGEVIAAFWSLWVLLPIFLLVIAAVLKRKTGESGKLQHTSKPPTVAPPLQKEGPALAMPLPLIIDGTIQHDHLRELRQTELWLRQQLRKLGYRDIKKIAYCSLKGKESFFIDSF
ncbi:YetF domain-containing protein [Bacillus sp. FSL W7-1282]